MLVCDKCGTLVEAHELPFVTEAHGEKHRNTVCGCGGEFVEATKCDVCGEWFDNRELDGVCEVCLAEYETVGDALAIGAENTTSVEINGFIAYALDPVVINEILTKWVEENITDHSRVVVDYCEDDKPWFADYVKEKVKGNREKSL
jgi:hypothetical protein